MSFFLHEHIYRDLVPIAEQPITICGAGALGANLTETLARMGLRRLRVIDRDRVEVHNLSTQPWQQQDVGAPKARVLANMLYRAVGARVDARHLELTETSAAKLLEGSRVVVDAFDNRPARRAVMEATSAATIPCLHIALGGMGDYGCGLWDDAYVIDEGGQGYDGCDYPLTRPLALLVSAAATEVLVNHLLDGSRRNFEVTLRDLRLT